MYLSELELGEFQSYGDTQRLRLEPHITLLAGRNNVGKSALFRGLTLAQQTQEGIRARFRLSLSWVVPHADMVHAFGRYATASGIGTSINAPDNHTFTVHYESQRPIPEGASVALAPSDLHVAALELEEMRWRAEGRPGVSMGWSSGPFNQGSTGTDDLKQFADRLTRGLRYVGPRRVEAEPRSIRQVGDLAPDARNLADVVSYLHSHDPIDVYPRVVAFMQETFPDVRMISVPTMAETGSGEIEVFFHGRRTATPLRLCGTGIEQMLALSVAIMAAEPGQVFLVDEPQAYLHPHAERSLLALIEAHREHQYVIATHSHVLLNALPVTSTRIATLADGETQLTALVDRGEALHEIGVTAADLGLAEHVLWVEGPSEEEVIGVLLDHEPGRAERLGIAIKRMPEGPSRFSAGKRIRTAYEFLTGLGQAIAPLPIGMTFLFDADEKSEENKQELKARSHGRARFLSTRELENLFLDADLLTSALGELPGNGPADPGNVRRRLDELLADTGNQEYFPGGCPSGADPRRVVRGSAILRQVFWEFARHEYDKVADGRRLAGIALESKSEALHPLQEILEEATGHSLQ